MALNLSTRTKVRLTGVEYRIETDCKEEPPPEDRRQANSQRKIGLNLIVRKLTNQVKRVLDSFLLVMPVESTLHSFFFFFQFYGFALGL